MPKPKKFWATQPYGGDLSPAKSFADAYARIETANRLRNPIYTAVWVDKGRGWELYERVEHI